MVPLMKLFTAKQSLVASTEVLEAFGGMGYI
jgi:alkylation response protein AidB-like acyl-CoA dehydrogenase